MSTSDRDAVFNKLLTLGNPDEVCPRSVTINKFPSGEHLSSFWVQPRESRGTTYSLPLSSDDVSFLEQAGERFSFGTVLVHKKEFGFYLPKGILKTIQSSFCETMVPLRKDVVINLNSLVVQTATSPGGLFQVVSHSKGMLGVVLLSHAAGIAGGDVLFEDNTIKVMWKGGRDPGTSTHIVSLLPGVEGHFSPLVAGHRLLFVFVVTQEGEGAMRPMIPMPLSFNTALTRVAELEAAAGRGLAFLLHYDQGATAASNGIEFSNRRLSLLLQALAVNAWGQEWGSALCQLQLDPEGNPTHRWFHCQASCDAFDPPDNFQFDYGKIVDLKDQELGLGHLASSSAATIVLWVLYIDIRQTALQLLRPLRAEIGEPAGVKQDWVDPCSGSKENDRKMQIGMLDSLLRTVQTFDAVHDCIPAILESLNLVMTRRDGLDNIFIWLALIAESSSVSVVREVYKGLLQLPRAHMPLNLLERISKLIPKDEGCSEEDDATGKPWAFEDLLPSDAEDQDIQVPEDGAIGQGSLPKNDTTACEGPLAPMISLEAEKNNNTAGSESLPTSKTEQEAVGVKKIPPKAPRRPKKRQGKGKAKAIPKMEAVQPVKKSEEKECCPPRSFPTAVARTDATQVAPGAVGDVQQVLLSTEKADDPQEPGSDEESKNESQQQELLMTKKIPGPTKDGSSQTRPTGGLVEERGQGESAVKGSQQLDKEVKPIVAESNASMHGGKNSGPSPGKIVLKLLTDPQKKGSWMVKTLSVLDATVQETHEQVQPVGNLASSPLPETKTKEKRKTASKSKGNDADLVNPNQNKKPRNCRGPGK